MNIWQQLFPFIRWSKELKNPEVVRADLIAGITVALVLIPQSMAYAQLAGLPVSGSSVLLTIKISASALAGIAALSNSNNAKGIRKLVTVIPSL